MRKIYIILFLFLLFFQNNGNLLGDDLYLSKLKTLKNEIDDNYYTFDIQKLKRILNKSYNITKSSGGDWHPHYYSGLLHYLLGKIYYQIDRDIAYNHFDKSLDYLFKANDKFQSAEVMSLISAAYGKKSALSPVASIYYGIKAKKYIEDAYELEKDNPKLLLVAATHLMHTPESFGGSKTKARTLLLKCLELNKNKVEKDEYLINWAEDAEICAYLGQLEVLNENKDKAWTYIQKALKFEPEYGFVLKDLIPQYEKIK
ncbi:MAG: hypothetical protein A2X61_13200 [Ignavibacteria bacterium GWB2_35_12]|nr:MAG: hypothetical protein A2X63_12410 [Ignavibacteria bacterium GWA2_35_8]OGU41417.1 MAG: hypothetical protein A2X61_13200 [Ignavibacteria bacterium GWB2_35_12]OGU95019.1 MAG: hypothetical protein A2220_09640 [Ignavibacteria bacterium RIFOXYA2_FULL_35_10]OGV19407.1 MAG: hypothetical protein A2475_04890 [Ignavibacteria bacterium RIFOXYC2_FULL_35_21]